MRVSDGKPLRRLDVTSKAWEVGERFYFLHVALLRCPGTGVGEAPVTDFQDARKGRSS